MPPTTVACNPWPKPQKQRLKSSRSMLSRMPVTRMANRLRTAKQPALCLTHPTARTVNTRSGGLLFTSSSFRYQAETDTYLCPANQTLRHKAVRVKDKYTVYAAAAPDCGSCELKSKCTQATKRTMTRHLYEEALERMRVPVCSHTGDGSRCPRL